MRNLDKARVKNLLVSTKAKHVFGEGHTGMNVMAKDRYRRNCGQELRPEERFCANCGRPVHATAHVPVPEADVPVPESPNQPMIAPFHNKPRKRGPTQIRYAARPGDRCG